MRLDSSLPVSMLPISGKEATKSMHPSQEQYTSVPLQQCYKINFCTHSRLHLFLQESYNEFLIFAVFPGYFSIAAIRRYDKSHL